MDTCVRCGAPRTGQGVFCGTCGHDQRVQVTPSPGPQAGYPQAPPPRRSPVGWIVAAALVAVGAACLIGWLALGRGETQAAAPVAATPAATSQAAASAAATPTAPRPAETPATAPVATSTAPVPGGLLAAPPAGPGQTVTITRAPEPRNGDSAPAAPRTDLPYGSYVLVLESLPKSTYSLASANATAARIGSASVLDSSTTPGLNSGYWAVVHDTYFSSKSAATAWCSSHSRSVGGACYPRRIG